MGIPTILKVRNLFGMVFLLDLKRLDSFGGAAKRNNAAGPIDSMLCSKRRVKSKFERHPWTMGPKLLSLPSRQLDAIFTTALVA